MTVCELLDSPEKWTKRVLARDAGGNCVAPDDPTACCWCLAEALDRCYGGAKSWYQSRRLVRDVTGEFVGDWNDSHTYEEVIALCRKKGI